MLLKEMLEYFQSGELAQLFVGADNPLRPENIKKLSLNINLGLLEIHKLLPVIEEELIIQQYEHIGNYHLTKEYALTNSESTKPYKYIIDAPAVPFKDNLLKIIRVYSETGEELPLNDPSTIYSLYTPSFNVLNIPYPSNDKAVSVLFLGHPSLIDISEDIDLNTNIDIPLFLLEPLSIFLSHKILGVVSVNINESINYMNRFSNAIKEIELSGILNRDNISNLRLENRGWV